jgi:diaminohydroxyphosphoribosylaminopyrimidine deaminase/5-amino-6-(5-phosphoribosylamino)uracil reductase
MARALRLAERGLYTTDPNPRVGCVLVKEDRVVGEGWHRRAGEAHAEVVALRTAGRDAEGATAYVTLEPCCHHGRTPPCTEALIQAGITEVIVAMQDPNPRVAGNGLKALAAAGIATHCGLLAADAEALNPGFSKRMRSGRPFVRSKLAMSLDGRTALASGASRWITGTHARRDVHRWRARSSAIITGVGTVLADNPRLDARLEDEREEVLQPVRVILDTALRTPCDASIARPPGRAVILTAETRGERYAALRTAGFEVHSVAIGEDRRPDLASVFEYLGRCQFNEVWVEAGAALNGALLRENVVDEWIIYLAPCILGDKARGLFQLSNLESMADRYPLSLVDVRHVGGDLRLRYRKKVA